MNRREMLATAGLATTPTSYAGHPLRAGFATRAAINGATELEIMRQTWHRSLVTLRH